MQTLISAFKDRAGARRAMDRLERAGFSREDIRMQCTGPEPIRPAADSSDANREIGERMMDSAEREVAVDRDGLEAVARFFVRLFGGDKGARDADRYSRAVGRGHTVVVVDAQSDSEAETAAVILHDMGATDVDDHDEGRTTRAGVRLYHRDGQPTLRDLVDHRHMREESIMATRAGQVTKDNEERAIAAAQVIPDRDRPR